MLLVPSMPMSPPSPPPRSSFEQCPRCTVLRNAARRICLTNRCPPLRTNRALPDQSSKTTLFRSFADEAFHSSSNYYHTRESEIISIFPHRTRAGTRFMHRSRSLEKEGTSVVRPASHPFYERIARCNQKLCTKCCLLRTAKK